MDLISALDLLLKTDSSMILTWVRKKSPTVTLLRSNQLISKLLPKNNLSRELFSPRVKLLSSSSTTHSRFNLLPIKFPIPQSQLLTNAENLLISAPVLICLTLGMSKLSRSKRTQLLTGLVRTLTMDYKESMVLPFLLRKSSMLT